MGNKFDARLRLNLNTWLESSFEDWDVRQRTLYVGLCRAIKDGARIEDRQVDLAMIGGPDLLWYLWEKHKGDSDYSVRKAIVENRLCPPDLLVKALGDIDWEVRRIVVRRPETPAIDIIRAARKERNEVVLEAMRKRLGEMFPEWVPEGPFGGYWKGVGVSQREAEVATYLRKQGHPHPDVDGTLDEFMNGGEKQAMYDEAVANNYDLSDVDRWFHLVDVLGIELKFETAMKIDRALYEDDLETMELLLPEERMRFREKAVDDLIEDVSDRAGERGGIQGERIKGW